MSAYMKFFTPSKKSVTDPNGGMINYPEICIDTNPRFEHKLTAHEIIILDQAAELERYETARQEDARRMEQVKEERDELFSVVVKSFNAMFEIGVGLAPEELTPRVRALDHALANDLNDELWERINAAALKDAK